MPPLTLQHNNNYVKSAACNTSDQPGKHAKLQELLQCLWTQPAVAWRLVSGKQLSD